VALVADTHAILWYLLDQDRLSDLALQALDQAARSGEPVFVSAISIVEIRYLIERGRLPEVAMERLERALLAEEPALVLVPLDLAIARAVARIPRTAVPDMPDRIIAATASHADLPLVTRDRRIRASGIATIW
jgi:PIN domain nuclease of toxin-antitoxin system